MKTISDKKIKASYSDEQDVLRGGNFVCLVRVWVRIRKQSMISCTLEPMARPMAAQKRVTFSWPQKPADRIEFMSHLLSLLSAIVPFYAILLWLSTQYDNANTNNPQINTHKKNTNWSTDVANCHTCMNMMWSWIWVY